MSRKLSKSKNDRLKLGVSKHSGKIWRFQCRLARKTHFRGWISETPGSYLGTEHMAGKSPATQNRTESIELRRKEAERPQTSQQEQQRECYVRHCAFFVEFYISLLPQDRLLTSLARTAACMSAAVGPGHGCWNALLVTKTNLSRPTWNSILHFPYPSLFCFFFLFSEEKQLYF